MSVAGADGAPVAGADVAVVVVDDAVLSLTGYKLADPISAMYAPSTYERPVSYLRSSLVLANPAVFGRARGRADDDVRGISEERRGAPSTASRATKASRARSAVQGSPERKGRPVRKAKPASARRA